MGNSESYVNRGFFYTNLHSIYFEDSYAMGVTVVRKRMKSKQKRSNNSPLSITASIKTITVNSKYSQQDTLQFKLPFEILVFLLLEK